MPACECGRYIPTERGLAVHRASRVHRLAWSKLRAQAAGVAFDAPKAMLRGTGRIWLDFVGGAAAMLRCEEPSLSPESSFIATVNRVSLTVRKAVEYVGLPTFEAYKRAMENNAALAASLILGELYGDAAPYVYWKVGCLHDDPDVRATILDALAANGAPILHPNDREALSIIALTSLLILEGERIEAALDTLHEVQRKETHVMDYREVIKAALDMGLGKVEFEERPTGDASKPVEVAYVSTRKTGRVLFAAQRSPGANPFYLCEEFTSTEDVP